MISAAYAATAKPDAGVSFPPFDASNFTSQIFWLVVAFGALYWTMSRIALPRMAQLLEDRRARIAADLDQATQMQAGAQKAGEAYEKSLTDARGNAQKIAQDTRAKLNADADTRRKTVEAELAEKLAAAEKQMSDMKSRALANVDTIATDAASAIIERLIGKAPASADVAAAVAAAKN